MNNMMDKAITMINKYTEEEKKNGFYNNVYSLLNMERDEVITHEATIYSIFQNKYSLEIKQQLFSLFMKAMELSPSYYEEEWEVEKEYFIGDGRMDLFFHSLTSKKAVVIELKIDADDQPEQLSRYYKYLMDMKYENFEIIYLTIDGKEPSAQSRKDIPEIYEIKLRSYGEHIKKWLEMTIECMNECGIESSLVNQYMLLIKKLSMENQCSREIDGLFYDKNSFLAGIAISEALEKEKYRIKKAFFDKVYELIEDKESVFYRDENFVCIKIASFNARNSKYSLAMSIENDYRLVYCVYFINKDEESIYSSQFERVNKKIYGIVKCIIEEVFETKIRENKYISIYYKNVKNSKGNEYDLKNVGVDCAELEDYETFEKESKFIAGQFQLYVDKLRKKLEQEIKCI